MSKEQSEAYKEMAKKDDTIYYREIDKEAFLYLNFRKIPKTHRRRDNKGISSRTSGKEGAGGSVKTAGASGGREAISGNGRARICRERKGNQINKEKDLSGSILDCMERYHTILSREQKEIIIESLEKD